jgi:hypothetical protein
MKNLVGYLLVFFFLILFMGKSLSQNATYTYSWYKYYTPIEGKIIGIWPHPDRYNDITRLKELKYKWGFKYIVFSFGHDQFNLLKQAGYDPQSDIMMSVEGYNYLNSSEYDQCWAYYLDEPEYKNISLNTMQTIKSWFNLNFPNVPFISSGFKRNSYLKDLTNNIADQVLFSSYVHWWEILGVWISWPVNSDQRDDWTDMKNLFGPKFTMTWVSANQDLLEYNDLVGHALNLGLSSILLYNDPSISEVDDNNLESFCSNATNRGYLTVNYQQVRDSYVNGVFAERQFVGPSYSYIPKIYDHANMIFMNLTVTNNRIDDYFASNSITAGSPYYYIIPATKKSTFNSNNEIILKPGFEAQFGSEFRAYITEEP